MTYWNYVKKRSDQVEQEVTQRDQFRNDDLDLADTLVRETIQNSLDADPSGQVTVRFRRLNVSSEKKDSAFVASLFDGHLAHAEAAGLPFDPADILGGDFEAIVIEDFGTCGLTGPTDLWTDDNFSDFWRRHGKSHKSGTKRGRHGLGKLVFSCSSEVGAFFGLTIRTGDEKPHLMGQCVLNYHEHKEQPYMPHGFYSDLRTIGDDDAIQVPVENDSHVAAFAEKLQLTRTDESGLSVVIPFPVEGLEFDRMIRIAILNYFFPILYGQLELHFDDEVINKDTLREMARKYAKDDLDDAEARFDFIETVVEKLGDPDLPQPTSSTWAKDNGWKLLAESVSEETLADLRKGFRDGEVVGLRLPITINHKEKGITESYFHIFTQHVPEQKGGDFYVRSGITVPGESKFRHRNAFGALIAEDAAVAGFLGNAENAAHNKWSGKAEKLRDYRNAELTLRAIRTSLVLFHDFLDEAVEEIDDDALLDILWIESPKKKIGQKKKGNDTSQDPPNPPAPRRQPVRVQLLKDGFSLKPNQLEAGDLPLQGKVTAAYDLLTGNPFKKHKPFDFDFRNAGDVAISMTNVNVLDTGANELTFEITGTDFELDVTGFDTNRDLMVNMTVS